MELTNEFNPQTGNLNWRENSLFENVRENFTYDNQDRLISYPNPNGVGVLAQTYETDGRIKTNTLGTYNYANAQKKYQNTSVTLSPEAVGYYASREGIFSDSMEDKKGWSKNAHNPSCISFDDTNAHLGKNSLKINTTGYTVSYVQSDLLIPINNTAATEYTFSGWVKSDNPTAQLTLFKYEENKTTYTTESVNTTSLGNWTFITKTVVVPANSKYLNLRVDSVGTGTVWFDDVMIRKTSNSALVNLQTPTTSGYTDQ